jgi:tetratricopeptide (TPR) repeat protein
LVIGISSCKTKSISVSVLKPAEIFLPSKINTLAVVNRSLPKKGDGSRIVNVLEGLVTGEELFADRNASQKCIAGVADGLLNSPRFKVTLPSGTDDIRGTGTAQFAEPLEWEKVEQICKNYNADALILLETFDSNTSKHFGVQQRKETVNGKEVSYNEHIASLDIDVNSGWRIYYPAEHKIVDQSVFTDRKAWDGKGRSIGEAERNLPTTSFTIEETGYFAGKQYAFRISPMWIWVSRKYFTKANDDFKEARYKVQAKQWEDAAEIWKRYVNDTDTKIAGYACYNMALASEVLGEFDLALDWAQRAYSEYHLKAARDYIYIIEKRIRDQEALKKQMNE